MVIEGCSKSAVPMHGDWYWLRDSENVQTFWTFPPTDQWLKKNSAYCGWKEEPRSEHGHHWVLLCHSCIIRLGYKW